MATTDVEVRPSRIEGLGTFATRAFRAGERIRHINVLREVTPEQPIREDLGERLDHCSYPDGKVLLLGFPDRHVNHSCDPNAHELFEGTSSYIVARRDIASGDEITLDYNINIANGTSWPCRCGTARCRGLVVGDFFLLPKEWQGSIDHCLQNGSSSGTVSGLRLWTISDDLKGLNAFPRQIGKLRSVRGQKASFRKAKLFGTYR